MTTLKGLEQVAVETRGLPGWHALMRGSSIKVSRASANRFGSAEPSQLVLNALSAFLQSTTVRRTLRHHPHPAIAPPPAPRTRTRSHYQI